MPQLGKRPSPPSLRLNLDPKAHLQQSSSSDNVLSNTQNNAVQEQIEENGESSRKRARTGLLFSSRPQLLASNASSFTLGCLSPTDSPDLLAYSSKLAAEFQRKQEEEDEGRIGPFCLLSPLDSNGFSCHALDVRTQEFKTCQVLSQNQYEHLVRVTSRLDKARSDSRWPYEDAESLARRILPSEAEIIRHTDKKIYLFSKKNFGSFHGYVQTRKKLDERETKVFFRQIVRLVAFCHSSGIVVRDLKLRKFVFEDEKQSVLRLGSVNDLVVCKDFENDNLSDRHGCPAYVSPEILNLEQKCYSGTLADIWSLGVMLFVILLGRYPFYASNPAALFGKIRQGLFFIPADANLSVEANFLLRGLLRREPKERPSALTLLKVPWILASSDQNLIVDYMMRRGNQQMIMNAHRRPKMKKMGKFVENDDQVVPCVPSGDSSNDEKGAKSDEVPSN